MAKNFGLMVAGGKGTVIKSNSYHKKGPKNKRKAKQRIAKERARMERIRRMEARSIFEENSTNGNDY